MAVEKKTYLSLTEIAIKYLNEGNYHETPHEMVARSARLLAERSRITPLPAPFSPAPPSGGSKPRPEKCPKSKTTTKKRKWY